MKKIKVLLLMNDLSLSGAPLSVLNIFEELRDEVEIRMVVRKGGPLAARCRRLGALRVLQDFPTATSESSLAAQLLYGTRRLTSQVKWQPWKKLLHTWKPDCIYINTVAALSVIPHISLPSAPVLLHVHELDSLVAEFFQRFPSLLLDLPNRYIAVSGAVRRMLVESYGVPEEKVSVIHPFIRQDEFTFSEQNTDARPEARFVVGGAGNTGWRKGVELWLLMAAELKEILGEAGVRFVWVGVGDDEASRHFRLMARKLKVDSCTEFIPLTAQPLGHFKRFDVFAMTSWEDPCPLVVLENMMLCNPVVCFAGGGGAAEEIGETGIVVEGFSARAMAAAIAELSIQPERRAALGAAARERVQQHFTASRQVPKVLDEIRRLVEKR